MAVLAFLVYFYTVLVTEKKTKFSTKSARKYAILTSKAPEKNSGEPQTPPPVGRDTHGAFGASTRLAPSALDLAPQLQLLNPPMDT